MHVWILQLTRRLVKISTIYENAYCRNVSIITISELSWCRNCHQLFGYLNDCNYCCVYRNVTSYGSRYGTQTVVTYCVKKKLQLNVNNQQAMLQKWLPLTITEMHLPNNYGVIVEWSLTFGGL